jgi:hypothetical protein
VVQGRVRMAAVAAVVLLAGCSGPSGGSAPLPTLTFPAMDVETVPLEPWEARGQIAVAWDMGVMAVSSVGEGGMPAMAVVDGQLLYTSDFGMGWTKRDLRAYVDEAGRGVRYLAWDLPSLLELAGEGTVEPGRVEAAATLAAGGTDHPATIEVHHTGGLVTLATVTTDADPESPFTFRPRATPFPFPVDRPALSLAPDEVLDGDAAARDGHVRLLSWIKAYQQQTGRLPAEATPDSLVLQRLGEEWPENPYSGEPMRDRQSSGDFSWTTCGERDGVFYGFGWDGAPLGETFGAGC